MDEDLSTCFLNHNLAPFHYACADKKNVNKRIMSFFFWKTETGFQNLYDFYDYFNGN